ncbi:nitrilotriacetate monooxygenase [Oceaniovalibus guishaninsula JLT2003]|uniref:Nitrilotriacetate monooxygenase n=1 Tax=Oceaniovalibus guishaninsula JLT2003 TaxID=1231392 RepID=K2HH70_9RHOB|nr:flavin reductase family protein [Oceaniovalibus guishaninsula]EKE45792.1 nitrilotriacetate monooxygenase [Oceaniovalibus guishaninsula JLT2003]
MSVHIVGPSRYPETDDPGRSLRDALGRFATGVTVVTCAVPGGPLGITANSFASVSLDPPLVLWCPAKMSSRYDPFVEAAHFAIHVMGAEQRALSQRFVREGQAFDGLNWRLADDGTPLIEGTLARFHCATQAVHDAGDHAIVVGRVLNADYRDGPPLIFSAGRYGIFQSAD